MNQRDNTVGGNLVGRDLTINNHPAEPETRMVRLRQRYESEPGGLQRRGAIDSLKYYEDPIDRIPMGLEKKLELGARYAYLPEALRAKELFAKCLARHSLSESAQEVIAYCLGQIQQLFKARVTPMIEGGVPFYEVDAAVIDQVLQPVFRELQVNFLGLQPQELSGMVYYLTGNCFLDWHSRANKENVPPSA